MIEIVLKLALILIATAAVCRLALYLLEAWERKAVFSEPELPDEDIDIIEHKTGLVDYPDNGVNESTIYELRDRSRP